MKKLTSLFFLLFTSCSVVMASNRNGLGIDRIKDVCTKKELHELGLEPLESDENGRVETYIVQKEKGSIARAFMHGLLDLSTGFLWELVGTPIEGSLNDQQCYHLIVTFDEYDNIQKMELQ